MARHHFDHPTSPRPNPSRHTLMNTENAGTLTHELVAWHAGDPQGIDRAWHLAYEELKRAAKYYLGNSRTPAISATTLIHDTYLKFKKRPPADFQSRAQFFSFAGKVIRHMIVDHIRHQKVRNQHEESVQDGHEPLSPALGQGLKASQVLAIDDALARLEKLHPRRAQITLLRYYAGFKLEEAAELMGISPATVKREWRMARMWFANELGTSINFSAAP